MKIVKKIIRAMHDEALQAALPDLPVRPDNKKQKRKKAKIKMRDATRSKPIIKKTPEERNKEMKKGRVPVFDREGAEPKHAKASKKKTPRI